jgi:hypothetical protein
LELVLEECEEWCAEGQRLQNLLSFVGDNNSTMEMATVGQRQPMLDETINVE